MEAGVYVSYLPGSPYLHSDDFSDYKGLKKRIAAIKQERAAQRRTPRIGGTTEGSAGGGSIGDRFRASSVFTPMTPARSTWLRSRSEYATGTTKATQSPDKSPPQVVPSSQGQSTAQTPRTLQLQKAAGPSAQARGTSDGERTPKGTNILEAVDGQSCQTRSDHRSAYEAGGEASRGLHERSREERRRSGVA